MAATEKRCLRRVAAPPPAFVMVNLPAPRHCPGPTEASGPANGLMIMQTVDTGRPECGPTGNVDLLVEKGFLLLGSIEFQIDEHLLSNGTRIDPETRYFMARVRDAAGDAATKMLDDARNRLETAPGAGALDSATAEAPGGEAAHTSISPTEAGSLATVDPGRRHGILFGRTTRSVALGTAVPALAAALLVTAWTASVGPGEFAGGADAPGIGEPEVTTASGAAMAGKVAAAIRPSSVQRDEKTGLAGGTSTVSVAGPIPDELQANYLRLPAEAGEAESSDPAGYRRLAETLALALHTRRPGEQPPYPDPRAGPEQTALTGEQAVALAAEQRLALSAGIRREVQHRLALAHFDPQHVDGIFGPATRTALGEWQRAAGIPATGYLDASALAVLRDQTADDYRAMQAANKGARRQAPRMVLMSPVPQASPLRANGCTRARTGKIIYGRGVRCDFRGLRQSIAGLFG